VGERLRNYWSRWTWVLWEAGSFAGDLACVYPALLLTLTLASTTAEALRKESSLKVARVRVPSVLVAMQALVPTAPPEVRSLDFAPFA